MQIPILSWLDRPVKQAIWSVFDDVNKATEALDIFKKYKRSHFRRLSASVRHIKILGMSQPIPLTEIYSPAIVSTTIFGRIYNQDWLSASAPGPITPPQRQRVGRLSRADEFIETHTCVVVLGSAGSGKTTLLRHLALSMCNKQVFEDTKLKTSRFPFFVSLPSYARETNGQKPIANYLVDELREYTDSYASEFVRRLLNRGLTLLILDSLDEVPRSLRQAVVDRIREVSTGFPECRIVVSCRTADYYPISENFYEVELARLTEDAVRTIVKAWFRDDQEKSKKILRHLKQDAGVRSLCETPLLLSLLCIQFRHDLALPKRKTELFRRCIDAFLRDWDAGRGFRRDTAYSSLSDDRKEKIFETVAGKFLGGDMRYVFPENELVGCIEVCCDLFGLPSDDAKGVLGEIEAHHGIIERFSADSYMFSHPSFQEYFAARNLLSQRQELEALRRNFADERWAGVIESVAAVHGNPALVLDFLAAKSQMASVKNFPTMTRRTRTLLLLYRCLSSGVSIQTEDRKKLYGHIVSAHGHMSKIFRNGGVFPFPVLMRDGVRYSYIYYHRRRTLHVALQPLRRLGNEIFLSPSDVYAEQVLQHLSKISFEGSGFAELESVASTLCLAVPIASSRPLEVKKILTDLKNRDVRTYESRLIDESLQVIENDLDV